jgi:hypothetical protein
MVACPFRKVEIWRQKFDDSPEKNQNKYHWHYTDKPGGRCAASGKKKKKDSRCRCFPTSVQHNLLPPSGTTISRVVADLGTACWVDLLPWI